MDLIQRVTGSYHLNYFCGNIVGKALRRKSLGSLSSSFNAHEVLPGIYVGDVLAAHNVPELKKRKITHIVNCILGVTPAFPNEFKYLHIQLIDCPTQSVSIHFNETCRFIEDAMSNDGKVLIHCMRGVSRSATLAAAYMMYQQGVTCEQAVLILRQTRPVICPNEGFMIQLQWYEKVLLKTKAGDVLIERNMVTRREVAVRG